MIHVVPSTLVVLGPGTVHGDRSVYGHVVRRVLAIFPRHFRLTLVVIKCCFRPQVLSSREKIHIGSVQPSALLQRPHASVEFGYTRSNNLPSAERNAGSLTGFVNEANNLLPTTEWSMYVLAFTKLNIHFKLAFFHWCNCIA